MGKTFGVLYGSGGVLGWKKLVAYSALVIVPLQHFLYLKLSCKNAALLRWPLGDMYCPYTLQLNTSHQLLAEAVISAAFLGTKAVVLGHANENTDGDISGILTFNAHKIEPNEENGVLGVEGEMEGPEEEKIHPQSEREHRRVKKGLQRARGSRRKKLKPYERYGHRKRITLYKGRPRPLNADQEEVFIDPTSAVADLLSRGKYVTPELPETDQRPHRLILMDNGMHAFLVSEKGCKQSAAALTVGVGSRLDGKEFPGIAHLCEHMLCMGSKKYPQENDYDFYITSNGGSSNAYTEDGHTTYYFNVSSTKLRGALDRLAQAMMSPLFNKSSVANEIMELNNEFQGNILDDIWRGDQLFRSLLHPSHPSNIFGMGNVLTLPPNNAEVRRALISHHRKFYSANIMYLSLVGHESLDELEAIVRHHFAAIPNKYVDTTPKHSTAPLLHNFKGKQILVLQIDGTPRIDFQFLLPDQKSLWRTKPARILESLLTRDSKSSLARVLMDFHLATGVECEPFVDDLVGAYPLALRITLTARGATYEGIKRTGELLFSYLNMLKNEKLPNHFKSDVVESSQLNFRFKESEEDPSSYCAEVADNFHLYPPDKVVAGPYVIEEFDDAGFRDCTNALNMDNMRLVIYTSEWPNDKVFTTEGYFETKYRLESIDRSYRQVWTVRLNESKKRRTRLWKDLGIKFSFPLKNEFLPSDLTLKPQPKVQHPYPRRLYPDSNAPAFGKVVLYSKQDDRFLSPMSQIMYKISFPQFSGNIKEMLVFALYASSISTAIEEQLELGDDCPVEFSIDWEEASLMVEISGFSDSVSRLSRFIFEVMMNPKSITETHYLNAKTTYMQGLTEARSPQTMLMELVNEVVKDPHYSKKEEMSEINKITFDDIMHLARGKSKHDKAHAGECSAFKRCIIEILVQGNVSDDDALEVANTVVQILKVGDVPNLSDLFVGKYLNLPPHKRVDLTTPNSNKSSRMSAVGIIVPFARVDWRKKTLLEVFALRYYELFYLYMRTSLQLGYGINCFFQEEGLSGSIGCLIETPYDQEIAKRETLRFFEFITSDFEATMTQTQFENLKKATISRINKKPNSLSAEFKNNFEAINSRSYDFAENEKKERFLRKLPYRRFKEFVEKTIKRNGWLLLQVSAQRKPKRHGALTVGRDVVSPKQMAKINSDIGKKIAELPASNPLNSMTLQRWKRTTKRKLNFVPTCHDLGVIRL